MMMFDCVPLKLKIYTYIHITYLLTCRSGIDGQLNVKQLTTGGVGSASNRATTLQETITLRSQVYVGGLPSNYQVRYQIHK